MTKDKLTVMLARLATVFDKEITPDLLKIYHQVLDHVPDDAGDALARHLILTCRWFPRPTEIVAALEELVHGPDDAEYQWGRIRADDYDGANDLARGIGHAQNLWGPVGAVSSAVSGQMAGLRKAFLEAYRFETARARTITRLGYEPGHPYLEHEAPARVLALAEKAVKGRED